MEKLDDLRGEAYLKQIKNRVSGHIGDDVYMIPPVSMDTQPEGTFFTDYAIFVEIMEGAVDIMINDVHYHAQAPCIYVVFPEYPVRINRVGDTRPVQRAMVMSPSFFDSILSMSLRLNDLSSYFILSPVLSLTETQAGDIDLFVRSLKAIEARKFNEDQYASVRYLCMAYFYGVIKGIAMEENKKPGTARESRISSEFKDILVEKFKTEHRTSFYSSAIGVSEKYLYMSVKAVTGKSPSYWVDFYLMSEAKRLLVSTDLSIKQISDVLNFSSQSHFCKFFKKHDGHTPYAFRCQPR